MRKSIPILLLVPMAAALLAACSIDPMQLPDAGRTPIRLTTSIALTRATTQDTQIASGEKVTVWAFEQSGTGAAEYSDAYIQAWALTADGSGNLTSDNTTYYYYPARALTLVGVHGNFSAGAFTEGTTAMPATLTHSIATDQHLLADYVKGDLLRWETHDRTATATAIAASFEHQLSKIVIELTSSEYSDAELDEAIVRIGGIQPTITLNTQTAALSGLTGAASTLIPYKTGQVTYEAIVPPQAKAADLISISLNGWTVTATPAEPASSFAAGTKYTYTVDVKKQNVSCATSISAWDDYTAGGTDPVTIVDNPGVAPRNIKMNPLWYVAEHNMTNTATAAKLTMGINGSNAYFYTWATAMSLFATSTSSITNYYTGYKHIDGKEGTWHLPVLAEWCSIMPKHNVNIMTGIITSNGSDNYTAARTTAKFGYNSTTKDTGIADNSYLYRVSATELHALRFLGTDYCSAWKYELGTDNSLTISATLIDKVAASESAARTWYNANFASVFFGNDENTGAVQRKFCALGYNSSGNAASANANTNPALAGYWSTTDTGSSRNWMLGFGSGASIYADANLTKGFPVRLFRDNPERDVWKNPLWYVAEYNMTNAQNAATLTMASTDNAGYYYTWADAVSTFSASTASYNGYKKGNKTISGISGKTWHLPTKGEYWSIVPFGYNPFPDGIYDENMNFYNLYPNSYRCYWGCDYDTKTTGVLDHNFFHKVSGSEIQGIRFLGTPYCSAWKYVFTGTTLIVSATMIDTVNDDALSARLWYEQNFPSVYFGNDASKGAVQRRFYARGANISGSNASANDGNVGVTARYWAATETNSTTGTRLSFSNGILYVDSSGGDKVIGFPVRLFLDN